MKNLKLELGGIAIAAIFTILILTVLFSGCKQDGDIPNFHISTIEGCEYFVSHNSYGDVLTHKGNCNNPIHKCN